MLRTMEGWNKVAMESGDKYSFFWDKYANIGDMVSINVIEYFRNIDIPLIDSTNLLQLRGESSSKIDKDGNLRPTYLTFYLSNKNWIYAGNCFIGEKENIL